MYVLAAIAVIGLKEVGVTDTDPENDPESPTRVIEI